MARDAKSLVAVRALKAILHTAKHMVEGRGVSTWDAPKVLKERQTIALLMEAVDGVDIPQAVIRQLVVSRGFAFAMVEVSDVQLMDAQGVLRDRLPYASLMEVGGVASLKVALKVLREALHSAKPMEVGRGAYLLGAPKVQKEARHYARGMAEAKDAYLMVEAYAQRVSMVERISVSLMVVERGVQLLAAPRVHVAELIVV